MSKKKKIIISSIVAFVLLAGLVTTLVLVLLKHYSTYSNLQIDYNTHTQMILTDYNTTYTAKSSITYSGGTQIIKDHSGKFGIYSWKDGRVVVNPTYSDIYVAYEASAGNKTYFRLLTTTTPSKMTLVDENGKSIDALCYDQEKKSTYVKIKTKCVELKNGKNGDIKATSGDTKTAEVYIKSFSLYKEYVGENFHYEMWKLSTTDDRVYINIYDISNDRELVQTIGANDGLDFDTNSLSLFILDSGEIGFWRTSPDTIDENTKAVNFCVYDKDYNLKKESTLDGKTLNNLVTSPIRVGNHLLIQSKADASDDDYNYATFESGVKKYYKYETYKLNLKNGNLKKINFDYLLNSSVDTHTVLNNNTSVLDTTKIKDKKADYSTYLLVNNRFQTSEIDYGIESIVRISEKRLITKSISGNYNLIDNKFNKICNLGILDSYFTTTESVVGTKDNLTYVFDLNGLTLKTYDNNEIINIKDKKYYMVKVLSEVDGKVKTEYFLERLSKRNPLPIYSHIEGENLYYSNGKKYDGLDISNLNPLNKNNFTLITKITKVDTYVYTYEICNIDGDTLLTKTYLSDDAKRLSIEHSSMVGDDYVVVAFDGKKYTLNR